jgi:hypothetical protein
MQIQENRQLLERASVMISQKAYTFINQATERTLQDWRLGGSNSDDGRGPRVASTSDKGVRALEVLVSTIHANQ